MIDLTDLMRGTVDAGPEWQQFPADTYPLRLGLGGVGGERAAGPVIPFQDAYLIPHRPACGRRVHRV
jgi:hypothetical protein